ncbi:hypothetical protein IE077_001605 [Cardiosporidium cionae]|uniref:Uncharacterized protein n=1 Tax=Cardiosporidium cionae TaxID=476202 RepID=A0ABQ7JCP3_9APIC|nr:hypothetical protein IE077_001605 [Cardiosporidium cionae]|eukprot:KAF8821773.1 hypothetical protein IE077_001605 [Cardiosporidium cionae]
MQPNLALSPWKYWKPIFGSVLIHFSLGCIHCFGNFAIYSLSFMRSNDGSSFRLKDAGIFYATMLLSQWVVSCCIYDLQILFGLQWLMFIGSYLVSFGIICSYFTAHSFLGFLLTYGIITNIGYGLSYSTSIAYSTYWIEKKFMARIVGLLCAARAMGIIVCAPLQILFLNPQNISADISPYSDSPNEKYFSDSGILNRIPYLFLYQGAALLIIQIVAWALSSPTPKIVDATATIDDIESDEVVQTKASLLRNRHFWLLYGIVLTYYIAASFFQSYWKILCTQEFSFKERYLSYLGSFLAVADILGRFLFGCISDSMGIHETMIVVSGAHVILLICMRKLMDDFCLNFSTAFSYVSTGRFLSSIVLGFFLWASSNDLRYFKTISLLCIPSFTSFILALSLKWSNKKPSHGLHIRTSSVEKEQ